MQVGILTTDGGAHPPDKWARATAAMLVDHLVAIDENSASAYAGEMRRARDALRGRLQAVLEGHHATVQTAERAAVAAQGPERLALPFAEHPDHIAAAIGEHIELEACVAAVVEEARVHPDLFAHFSTEAVRAVIRERLLRDFGAVIDIERDWHANGWVVGPDHKARENPDHDRRHPAVQAWKNRRHPGPHPSLSGEG